METWWTGVKEDSRLVRVSFQLIGQLQVSLGGLCWWFLVGVLCRKTSPGVFAPPQQGFLTSSPARQYIYTKYCTLVFEISLAISLSIIVPYMKKMPWKSWTSLTMRKKISQSTLSSVVHTNINWNNTERDYKIIAVVYFVILKMQMWICYNWMQAKKVSNEHRGRGFMRLMMAKAFVPLKVKDEDSIGVRLRMIRRQKDEQDPLCRFM